MKNRKGVTLIELLVVVAIIAIISVVFANIITVPANTDVKVRKEYSYQEKARNIAKSIENEIRMQKS